MTDKSEFFIEGHKEKLSISQLVERLSAERAALLDRLAQVTAARMEQLDPANLPADIATILGIVGGIAGGANWNPYGPRNVEVGNDVTVGVTVYDPGGGIVPMADITEGTYTIERIRGAVLTSIVGPAASSSADGLVCASYNFPVADWQVGDIFIFTFEGIAIDIAGTITEIPPVQLYGRVVREADIQSTVTTIDTNVGAMEGAVGLHNKLTAARAALLDQITAARLGELDAANIPTDLANILAAIGPLASVFQEQAEIAVNIDAIAGGETDFLNLAAAGTRYIVRDVELKCADPGANTVTVRLYKLVNGGLILVDTFDITATNFATYFSLMDIFGRPHLAGDQIQITVRASAGGPYAVTGSYGYGMT